MGSFLPKKEVDAERLAPSSPSSSSEPTTSTARKEVAAMSRAADRVLFHWNSKGKPLARHRAGGTAQYRRIVKAVLEALKLHPEKVITDAIDLYHKSLLNPSLTRYRYRNMAPTRVNLDEFFCFSIESLNLIAVHEIQELKGVRSWFDLCRRGERFITDRFGIVPEDRFPVVTEMLRKEIRRRGYPTVLEGNSAERQLRRASKNLVEFHSRIRARILTWQKLERLSAVYFLEGHLSDFLSTRVLNSSSFKLYWITGERFIDDFEGFLLQQNAITEPRLVRHLKKRAAAGGRRRDQGGAFRGRGGEAHHNWYDNERDISAADFENL